MLVSLTVGKVDAGVTVLLTPDKRLIEFPSILLPPNISSGSIVDINVARNSASESNAENAFRALQDRIFSSFGTATPKPPVLRCRNATQTSVVLEWDTIDLATADLLSLSLYRNGQKAGAIPRPLEMHSTKISGLSIDTDYTFHLVLRTTAGTYASERVTVRTHKMTDLSGITITTGILPAPARDALAHAVERIGAKIVDGVRIDTTHFVTTEGRGLPWEKAVEMNIPVVRPEWVDACERTGRILGVTKFYLDAMRPGPGDFGMVSQADNSPTTDRRTSMPPSEAQHQRNPSKDLPPVPQGSSNGDAVASPSTPNENGNTANESEKATSNGNEKTPSGADEQKVQLPDPDEQKVRLEESDVPIRPANLQPSISAAGSDISENEGDMDEKAGKSPGDGGSFQDVAL